MLSPFLIALMKPEIYTYESKDIQSLVSRLKTKKILSTLPYKKIDFWWDNVDSCLAKKNILTKITSKFGVIDVFHIFKLLRKANKYDAVLITGGERGDLIYLALAGLLQYIKTPHVIVDAHWEPEQGIAGFVQRLILKMGSRVIHQVQVHSPEECDVYEKEFGINKQKIVDIPFSTSLIGYDLEERSGDFILTGGRSFRDYPTFCKAIENLPYKVEIGLPSDYPLDEFNKIQTKSNVTIHTTLSNREFMDKMASCKVLALPITPKLKRSTADQTILNAMYFGKIVIATNSIGSRIYIEDGVNGFLVDEEDSESWKEALKRIYNLDSHIIENIQNQAKYDARNKFSEDIRLYKTLDSALNSI